MPATQRCNSTRSAPEMEQFVALAAHDLRAPIRNIATIADMLRDGFVDRGDGKMELLETLENIATKTMELVSNILEHIEIAGLDHPDTTFSFPALCHDICDTLDPSKMHNITTSTATLSCDRTAMQIALGNMLDNAIKHGGRDNLNITIEVREGMPGMLEVTITDDGCGFSSDALKLMNESLFRSQSGYGLFAVKRLISARKGTVLAQNLPKEAGAVVCFSLPGIWMNGSANLGDNAPQLPDSSDPDANRQRHRA
ncbi:Sensor protein ZraS [Nymphon striatum]|nr:Sensor protein ZraS [Nymphon striatum]